MEDHLTQNPNFDHLEEKENTELRFFCEAFSLIDSMTNTSLLLAFSNSVKESKNGKINWKNIPDLHPADAKSTGYLATIQRIGHLVEKVVVKGWVTSLRIKSLSALALEIYNIRKNSPPQTNVILDIRNHTAACKAWKELSTKLKKLAEFQDKNMAIHEDFQKENYLPHPDSWKVYLSTFIVIFSALLYCAFFK